MEWTVSGLLGGRQVSATWSDEGEGGPALDGDPEVLARFAVLEGATVGFLGGGPYYPAGLEPWQAAYCALHELLEGPLEVVGDFPAELGGDATLPPDTLG